jgi:hypothetical protein
MKRRDIEYFKRFKENVMTMQAFDIIGRRMVYRCDIVLTNKILVGYDLWINLYGRKHVNTLKKRQQRLIEKLFVLMKKNYPMYIKRGMYVKLENPRGVQPWTVEAG